MKIDPELLRGLIRIALIAKDEGYLHEAESIFEVASIFRPDSAYPCIGKAEVLMHKGLLEKAVTTLRNAPIKNLKEQELCHCYLGRALKLSGYYEEAQKILKEIKNNGTYDLSKRFAKELYEADFSVFFR